ncbi:MAG TPA: hypothetical protein VF307_04090 [Candidatus Nanopelagicaceae bacterium]
MSEKEFSLEQSEELIANLKSGQPSEFEQLRSALNLLAHVPEISPVSTPPVLPSTITQPAPVIPIRSSKQRRTIVTSIIVMGLFGTGSLAAAAVTGIGPSIFVNAGHSAAKFVENVVGGVDQAVTGNNSDSNQNQASGVTTPGTTRPVINSNSNEEGNQNDSEESSLPLISKLIPPLSTTILTNSGSHENESQTTSHETQSPSSEESHKKTPDAQRTQPSGEDQNQSESHASEGSIPSSSPAPDISILPTPITLPTGSSDHTESDD